MTLARENAPGEYYHIFNRGAHKTNLFKDEKDWLRFLFLILHSQSPISVVNISRFVIPSALVGGFKVPDHYVADIVEKRFVEIVSFCLMPNHFHLILKESIEGGISEYMQRIAVGYTMYFNTKYKATGHVFQGRYKSVHIKDNNQLTYLSAYIHRNPRELSKWKGREESYPYSSFQDLALKNRWGDLLAEDIITSQFDGTKQSNYLDFVNMSTAKLLNEQLPDSSLSLT
jgi:putative transposase